MLPNVEMKESLSVTGVLCVYFQIDNTENSTPITQLIKMYSFHLKSSSGLKLAFFEGSGLAWESLNQSSVWAQSVW